MDKSLLRIILPACALWLAAACAPRYDWRQVRGQDAPFTVLMPAKPEILARPIELNGSPARMTMTAAQAGDTMFAVGVAELSDTAAAAAALTAMKAALVRNIGGVIRREQALASGALEIEAASAPGQAGGQPRLLLARLIAVDRRVYQVVAVGPENAFDRDAAAMFFDSFRL